MKNYLLISFGFFVVLIALITGIHFYAIDGLDGFIFSCLLKEDTVYASGYSNSRFRQVQTGMSISEVHKILGPPIDTWERTGTHGERWSMSPHSTHYRCRVLLFENGKVVRKHAEFYVD